METTQLASGTLFIHSAPTALRSHIEWAADAAFAIPAPLRWTSQPVEPGTWRAETPWRGDVVVAGKFISTLAAWQRVRVEMTVETGAVPHRWSLTPSLGIFSAHTDEAGSVLVDEMRLRAAVTAARRTGLRLEDEICDLLGEPWDVELEAYRACDPSLDVSWLAREVG
ncbi:DUF3145 family protein [Cutibacterium avidum]|uniref:DUF3145 family protein n=1 Tax=Cutibacterium avidum TaxID=33010 RepID=UPI0022E404DF|nr:DUF3145 family protein [Cutibacterium avidum]MDU7716640.1 DUF3145 family protein [Cutibacterium avidum]MDU7816589.1 DUF3145 family protein [Bacillota bacterium]